MRDFCACFARHDFYIPEIAEPELVRHFLGFSFVKYFSPDYRVRYRAFGIGDIEVRLSALSGFSQFLFKYVSN
jgi:hypothetical protein